MTRAFTLLIMIFALQAVGQSQESDWDAYVMDLKGRPVSIVVDLGLAGQAPMKDRTFAILVRTRLQDPKKDGQPSNTEVGRLDTLEENIVHHLTRATGAVYAGRFTQRGIREFCFYALDSVGFAEALSSAFAPYPGYEWLGKAVPDKSWSNYFDMLYPAPDQLARMKYRRQSDALRQQGDLMMADRSIEHLLRFKTRIGRDQFLRQPDMGGFTAAEIQEETDDAAEFPFVLKIQGKGIPDYRYIDQIIMHLRSKALALKGRYEGWVCEVIR